MKNWFRKHLDLKSCIKAWKKLTRGENLKGNSNSIAQKQSMKNKSDGGTLKKIGIHNVVVKEQVWSKQREQRNYYTTSNSVEANDKIEQLEK